MLLACQVCPFHLKLTQINTEMNCIAKNKCPESQKLDKRTHRGELERHITRVKSNNIYIDKVKIVTRSYSLEATTNAQNNRYCYMIP